MRLSLVLSLGAVALGVALSLRPALAWISAVDVAVLRLIEQLRADPVTEIALDLDALGSRWVIRTVAWTTIAVLVASRRFHHLIAYLTVMLGVVMAEVWVAAFLGRPRPAGVAVLGQWEGYAHPSAPVSGLALVLTGAVLVVAPRGRHRTRAAWLAAGTLGVLALARLYLGVDHPTDVAAGLVLGSAVPVAALRFLVPEDVFPVTYRRGTRAHLDVGGRRGEAIVEALDRQLGLSVVSVEPFGLEGSAGSTPLRICVRKPGGGDRALFGKLYARSHLRSDRWYKLGRTVFYGRLEDEKPFSSVRRLVEYEDHLLRLLRDAGLPTPAPYGFVAITPEREYLVVMEMFEGAQEIGEVEVDDDLVDDALSVVRRLWEAGVAHRDIKPSNLLVRDGRVLLIDVAFATVRPTPWREAVDLANMMLTLALATSSDAVHRRALRQFAPDDIAEAFAATHGITIPTRLRNAMRADGRDLVRELRSLSPPRPPIAIQLWSFRRIALTIGLLLGLVVVIASAAGYARIAGLA